jgi:hypothetical protein
MGGKKGGAHTRRKKDKGPEDGKGNNIENVNKIITEQKKKIKDMK